MVQVTTSTRGTVPSAGYSSNSTSQGTPQIHVHFVHRDVFGNGIAIRSYGETAKSCVKSRWRPVNSSGHTKSSGNKPARRKLKLNTLQVLLLTPEVSPPQADGYAVEKAIWRKGEYDNYASINVWDLDKNFQGPGTPPDSHLDGEEDNGRLDLARLYSAFLRWELDGLRRVVRVSSGSVCAG